MKILLSILLTAALSVVSVAQQRLTYSALLTSAKIYLNETPKDYEMARARLEQAIRDYPNEPPVEAHVLLGEIHAEKDRYAEMAEHFRIADSICSVATNKKLTNVCRKERVQERIRNVRQSVWINEFNEGAQHLAEARSLSEGIEDIDDKEELEGLLEDILSEQRSALNNFTQAVTINPDSAQGWVNLGLTYYRLSTVYAQMSDADSVHVRALKDSSITVYQKAAGILGDSFDLLQNLSTIYFELQNWPKCSEVFGMMADLQPDNATVLQNLVWMLLQLGMDDSARVVMDKGIALDPENIDLRMRRGYMEIEHGSLANDTINELRQSGAEANKAEIERITENRNNAWRTVIEDFTVVTRLQPDNYEAWYFIGACEYFLEDYEGARDAWEAATQIKPQELDVWERLAPLYLMLGDPEKSQEAQRKIKELSGS